MENLIYNYNIFFFLIIYIIKSSIIFINLKLSIFRFFYLENILFIDKFNYFFFIVILIIRFLIIYYIFIYLSDYYYLIIVIIFILIIIILVLRLNLVYLLIWWDLLGLISFLLVIYYNNYIIIKIRILIILFNRLGDIFILFIVIRFFINLKFNLNLIFNILRFSMILFRLILKSSQFPLNLWLTKAIIAPLPISSLVHSSTLVTIGVYFIFRFNNYLRFNLLLYFIIFRLIYYGLIIFLVYDIKKLIALSTINNLRIIIFFLYIYIYVYIYIYIIIHAIFKSIIFLCLGILIYNNFDMQDRRKLSLVLKYDIFMIYLILLRELICTGIIYFSIFICKDLFFDSLNLINIIIFFFF